MHPGNMARLGVDVNSDRILEALRGERIERIPSVADIPCEEASDAALLCRHPVVSVRMITYNHSPYIRQAIESVMAQDVDFEFELIIGEDCSTDETREICFEYQRKYPKVIRVLWSAHNVGGACNDRRVASRCRGEFEAWCEGDDYWSDRQKLKKQVGIMRAHPEVGLCVSSHYELYQNIGRMAPILASDGWHGILPGREYLRWELFRIMPPGKLLGGRRPFQTATMLVRTSCLERACSKFSQLFDWQLRLNDTLHYMALASVSDVYFHPECMSVYRVNASGVSLRCPHRMYIDAMILKLKFIEMQYDIGIQESYSYFEASFVKNVFGLAHDEGGGEALRRIRQSEKLRKSFFKVRFFPLLLVLKLGIRSGTILRLTQRIVFNRYFPVNKLSRRLCEALNGK